MLSLVYCSLRYQGLPAPDEERRRDHQNRPGRVPVQGGHDRVRHCEGEKLVIF